MPDKIKLPVKGKQRTILLIVTAGAAAYVGWSWWKARGAATTPPGTGGVGAPIDASGVVGAPASGNVQYAGTTQGNPGALVTNADWTADAVGKLSSTGGWDPAAVYAALGRYLGRQPLSSTDETIVRAATAASGPPPVGGPYTIVLATAGTTTPAGTAPGRPATPGGLVTQAAGPHDIRIGWNPVAGATGYQVNWLGHGAPVDTGMSTSWPFNRLPSGTRYQFQVRAVNGAGYSPWSGTLTVKTAGTAPATTAPKVAAKATAAPLPSKVLTQAPGK